MKRRLAALGLAFCLVLCFSACEYVEQAFGLVQEMMGQSSSRPEEVGDTRSWQQRIEDAAAAAEALPAGQADGVQSWYEVCVRTFCDDDADGVGDFAGLQSRLDYVEYLGFEGIRLLPVMPAADDDNGDVTSYTDIDVDYGTLESFDRLLAGCSQRGLGVMLDLPIAHTSGRHAWFSRAVAALAAGNTRDAAVGYYDFAQEDGGTGWYAVPGVEGWWYRGGQSADRPALNLQSDALRGELEAVMVFWLNRGVEGFYLGDAQSFVPEDAAACTEVLEWASAAVKAVRQTACVVAANGDDTDERYTAYASGVDGLLDGPFAGADGLLAQTVQGSAFAAQYGAAMVNMQALIAAAEGMGRDVPNLTDAGGERAADFLNGDADRIKMALGMSLLQGGNAFVYYGEELGMAGSAGAHTPQYWSAVPGVFGMAVGPADEEKQAHTFAPAMEQIGDESAILNAVRQANALRRQYPAIVRGNAQVEDMGGIPLALTRVWNEQAVLVAYNPTAEEAEGRLPAALGSGGAALGAALSATGAQPALEEGQLLLPAYSIAVLEIELPAGAEGDDSEAT